MIENYDVYVLSGRERLIYYALSCALIGACTLLFFDSPYLSAAAMPLAVLLEKRVCAVLAERRRNRLRSEFVDLLYSLSSSIAVGAHMREALYEARGNLKYMQGKDQLMMGELDFMLHRIESSNESERLLLMDFAQRSGVADIRNFVEVYYICRDTGGNLLRAVNKSAQMIMDKLVTENDIRVYISQKTFEGRLIAALPIVIITFLRFISPDYLEPLY